LLLFILAYKPLSKIFGQICLLFSIILFGYCCIPPSTQTTVHIREHGITHETRNSPVIYVYFDQSYSTEEKVQMSLTFGRFAAIGLRSRFVESHSFFLKDVYVRNSEETFTQSDLGMYSSHTSYIQVPINRMESFHQLQMIFMHEIGHWLGMKHICMEHERNIRSDCSSVGYGNAIMNPINVPAMPASFSELDRLEFQRINHL
jgi:hypothetical protein